MEGSTRVRMYAPHCARLIDAARTGEDIAVFPDDLVDDAGAPIPAGRLWNCRGTCRSHGRDWRILLVIRGQSISGIT